MGRFYHIKNLQSTKTKIWKYGMHLSFITLRIYKVLKLNFRKNALLACFITLRIYKVLKLWRSPYDGI